MNEISVLRRINSRVKYTPIPEYIGLEIPLRIVDEAEVLGEIQNLIHRHLSTNIIAVEQHYVMGTIAKYGMIDLTFEVDGEVPYNPVGGIQILKDNGWIDKESPDEYKMQGFEFLKDMLKEAEENKNYLKIYAKAGETSIWVQKKSYLMNQLRKGQQLAPLPEDELQVFTIKDMCYTNCKGIWFAKHFYM